ncbi:Shedu anti-phage system protein SduA domain-containing protein [Vibrio parahaemolyticus]|nr:DUF4263 domain-containing protein [Vibrio parahaemolyticus]EGR0930266.1 DUF4263 domain-containing protein [Vibrio parahaemolyticus]EGR3234371.1 DUF4263 domain-containing protein [Vibrio parahaemolyticus]EJG0179986.1 DUF4263 domain-containing protein [Vibrio parahaemolyticus]EJM9301216.1 DUF4263 domain-containing protein [Vibrio parahaemolyticus]
MSFDVQSVRALLNNVFQNNSEVELLKVLKNNSFLFHSLYTRKFGIQPNFAEVPFGSKLRCDFCWLNDNSDGPEWVLVEIEKPNMKLFNRNGEPSSELNHAIEQVKSWERYFHQQPAEKQRIFGAVSKFRFVLVAGRRDAWQTREAAQWRAYHNQSSTIEIHSTDIFYDALDLYENHSDGFWSFEENPVSLASKELEGNWSQYDYIGFWRKLLT